MLAGAHAQVLEPPRVELETKAVLKACIEARAELASLKQATSLIGSAHSGVGHSFTNPEIDKWNLPGFAYDSCADRRSWRAMRALLEESLG